MTGPATELRILDALPQSVSVVDAAGRLAFANPAFWQQAGLDPAACPPGTPLPKLVRLLAYRGLYGAGDPEELAQAVLAADRSRPTRRQIGTADGSRSLEIASVPLPDGCFVSVGHDITPLLRAREEQAARARLLEATLARLRGGVVRFDAEMRLSLFNPAYETLIGLPGGALRAGMMHREILAVLDERGEYASADERDAVAERMEGDRAQASTRTRRRLAGPTLRFDSQPMPDGGFLLEVTDVTALQRAEDEARRRAALLDGVLEALPHGICVYDADRRIAMFNAAYARQMGSAGIAVGDRVADVVARRLAAGEYDAAVAAEVLDRFAPGRDSWPTIRRMRPDGTVLETSIAPLPDGGVISVFADVTALHAAEQAAKDRAELLDAVLEALPDGVCVYGPDRRARVVNPAYRRILGNAAVRIGESLEELADRRVASGEQTREMAEALLRRHFDPEREVGRPIRRLRPDGTAIVTRAGRLPDGGYVSVITDVTALHRAEEELGRRAAVLEASFGAMRHGIAIFDAERRLVAANGRTGSLTGLPDTAHQAGRRFEELVAEQVARGFLTGTQGQAVLALDRGRPQRYLRRMPDGRMVEILSDPTSEGGFVVTFSDVTALHRAEEELGRRAAMLEASFGAMRHGIAIFGPDRRLLAANARTAELTGLPASSITPGRSYDDLLAEQVARGIVAPAVAETTSGRDRSEPRQVTRTRPDGRIVEIVSDPTPDGGFVVTFHDVTALRRAEAERRERAALMEAGFAAIQHGIAIFGPDRLLRAFNARLPALNGAPPEDFEIGRSMEELIARQRERGAITAEQAARSLGLDRSSPQRYQRLGTNGRTLEIGSDPMPDGGFVVTFNDVTDLLAAQAEARHHAAMQAAMLGTIRHGIIMYGPDRRLLATNAKTADLTGMPPDRLAPGRLMDELLDEQVLRGELTPAEAAGMKALDRRVTQRYGRRRRDGRVIDTVSEPMPDGGYVITYSDVTEERAIRAELEHARIQAEAASAAKSRFLATMSHELRTPLTAVIGFSEAIAQERDRTRLDDYAAMINEAGRHLLQLVDDILDVARSQSGTIAAAEQPVAVGDLLRDAANAVAPAAVEAGLMLAAKLPAELPLLRGDARRLRQVLDKLLSNAVKFTPSGGCVTLSAVSGPEGLEIRVTDTGIGIPPAERERVFEPFTQLDGTYSRRFQGSGLGLHLARLLAGALGGTLSLEDPEGSGPEGPGPEGSGIVAVLHFPPARLLAGPGRTPEAAGALPG